MKGVIFVEFIEVVEEEIRAGDQEVAHGAAG